MATIDYNMTAERKASEDRFKEWLNSIDRVDENFNIVEPKLFDDPDPDPGD